MARNCNETTCERRAAESHPYYQLAQHYLEIASAVDHGASGLLNTIGIAEIRELMAVIRERDDWRSECQKTQ